MEGQMEYIPEVTLQTAQILCCQCGVHIEPNPANMCVGCIRTHHDITSDIPKQGNLYFCHSCERYLRPPKEWVRCQLESRDLLALCLGRLKSQLTRVRLIDAGFVWTEPHSKRIKVKLTVQAEVCGGAVLQQTFIVEFAVQSQMCDDCHRVEAKDFWRAQVQVRQHAVNKKTFYYLEQLILKHRAHSDVVNIKLLTDGVDFFFANEAQARKLVDFLGSVLPIRSQKSERLISHDIHSNTYNYKRTFCVDIVPLSKDSAVCLPKKFAAQLGGITQLCLIYRVSNVVHLIDPATAQIAEINSAAYYRHPFVPICDPRQLQLYIVVDIDCDGAARSAFPGQGAVSKKHAVADVWVSRESDLGKSDPVHTKTHLGYLLKPGDLVYGYNIADSNVNDNNFDSIRRDKLPDVILVKKYYGSQSARRRRRNWKLRHLVEDDPSVMPVIPGSDDEDYNDFLNDLEEDPTYRQHVNVYKRAPREPAPIPVDEDDIDQSAPTISLQEMLEDLTVEDVDMDDSVDQS